MGSKKINSTGILRKLSGYLQRNRVGEILVSRGKLTPQALKEALSIHKQGNIPLGRVLLEKGLISKGELRFALASQTALRSLIAIVAIMTGLISLSSRQAHAGGLKEIPKSITVAFSSVSAGSITGYTIYKSSLFGTGERASSDLSSFTKWSAMFDRFSKDVNSGASDTIVQKWKKDLTPMKGLPLIQMANEVNNLMNKVRYIGDNKNWGKSDYWGTPIEFLTYGGDCEDFAIAKYISLRALGVPDQAMRIAIVKDLQKGIPHAILIVYTENGPMVLDNQIKKMTEANDIGHYKPIFSINRTAWWLHNDNRNSNPTQIASASR